MITSTALSGTVQANGISLLVCTYNGADRVGSTLKAIACCHAPAPVEIVLIDNNSTDGTAQQAKAVWSEIGNPEFAFSIVHEPRQGLSFARQAGIAASRNEIIVFVDDDNAIAPDYLQHAWSIMTTQPDVGVLGGDAEPTFGSEPPDWFLRNQGAFALGKQGEAEGDITEGRGWVWGAGAVFRRAALSEVAQAGVEPVMADRRGNKMTTGGDVELCLYLGELGWKVWYSPRLKLKHHMPTGRFNWKKFCALNFENGVLAGTVVQPLRNGAGRIRASARAVRLHLRWFRGNPSRESFVLFGHSLLGELTATLLHPKRVAAALENKARLREARLKNAASTGLVTD